jgi:hypothetical protein
LGEPASGCVQTAPTPVAFEVLRLLVRDENLEVVEVALAVIAPWSLELLVEVWIPLPLLCHCGYGVKLSGQGAVIFSFPEL